MVSGPPLFAFGERLARNLRPEEVVEKKAAFKAEYIENGGMLTHACRKVKVDPATVRLIWLKKDPEFKAWYDEHYALQTEKYDREIEVRADTALTSSGMPSKMSDRLLMFVASRRTGSRYEDRTVPVGHLTLQVVREDHRALPPAQYPQLAEPAIEGELVEQSEG